MPLDNDLFRKITGRNLDQVRKPTTLARLAAQVAAEARSDYAVRPLGESGGSFPFLTEEQRGSHIHVLGTTREGKSKLVELLIRQDIDAGYGCTLLDPSSSGRTMAAVLRYCAQVGHERVCIIDPHDHGRTIPCINPMRVSLNDAGQPYAVDADAKAEAIMESLRMVWGTRDFADTTRIQTYMNALATVLIKARCSLPDAQYFRSRDIPHVRAIRDQIMARLYRWDESRLALEEVFNSKGAYLFQQHFQSTILRLVPFFKYLPSLIYGSTAGTLDYMKMVREKWVVLVNLYAGSLWGVPQQRALGTLVINELSAAVRDLTDHAKRSGAAGWTGRHYLYLDEAGHYTTRVLAEIMAHEGGSGLWATLAHQYYGQFEDEKVMLAVLNLCKIKVMFNVPSSPDRNRMLRDMFSGSLPADLERWLERLQKQEAVIKIQKNDPAITRIEDVPDARVSDAAVDAYREKIYSSNPWYRSKEAIQEETKNRFVRPKGEPVQDLRAAPPSGAQSKGGAKREPGADTPGAGGSKVLDGLAGGEPVLRGKGGRQPRKRDPGAAAP